VKGQARQHYSYSTYADPRTAQTFDDRRFGGPIGELIAAEQARVLAGFVGRIDGRTVLDVGTGTGRAALLLARGGARVTGVDASEEMLRIARARATDESASVTFLAGDAHKLQFADRSFDVVVCLRVVMHSPQWKAVVAELCRTADQLVILDFPSKKSVALVQSLFRKAAHALSLKTEPYRVFTDRDIETALSANGFRVRSKHRQFVLPIGLHKLFGSRRLTLATERVLEKVGLLTLVGSPVTVVAERCELS
jgi:SAM-dependent methyltransferase